MNPHIPTIRIRTPEPDEHGVTPGILHRIWVDGHEWAVTAYSVGAEASDIQKITLTFLADVVIDHEAEVHA